MPASIKHLSQMKALGPGVLAVLAKWSGDRRFYKVKILNCDKANKKCKVRYEDNYECLMDSSDLHLQLALGYIKDELIVCSVCDGGESTPPNEIFICDICQQGYHAECHQPKIDQHIKDDDQAEWCCFVCRELFPESDPVKPSVLTETINYDVAIEVPTKAERKVIPESTNVDLIETEDFVKLVASGPDQFEEPVKAKVRVGRSKRIKA